MQNDAAGAAGEEREQALAAAVATRLMPQLQRIEQMLQELQRKQLPPLQQPPPRQQPPQPPPRQPPPSSIFDVPTQPVPTAPPAEESRRPDGAVADTCATEDALQRSDSGVDHRAKVHHIQIEEEPKRFRLPEEPPRDSALARFLGSYVVEHLILIVIVVNVGVSISRANRMAATLQEDVTRVEETIELFCLGVFTVELVLKCSVHRLFFFTNEDMWWNMFDLFIVSISIIEQLLLLLSGSGGTSIGFARVIRVFKACKVLRIVRALRFLQDLRMMMECVLASALPLFWCCVLFVIVILIFALFFINLITEYRMSQPETCADQFGLCEDLQNSFASVQQAMLTLGFAVTGGRSWSEVLNMTAKTGIISATVFVMFKVFFMFAFFNIVAAIFLDRVLSNAQPDKEERMMKKRHEDMKQAKELKDLISKMDKEGRGIITEAEIVQIQDDEVILESLELAGLNVTDMHQFFRTLCKTSGTVELGIDTFVDAAFQMKGVASAVDVQTLLISMQDVHQTLRRLERNVEYERQAAMPIIGYHLAQPMVISRV